MDYGQLIDHGVRYQHVELLLLFCQAGGGTQDYGNQLQQVVSDDFDRAVVATHKTDGSEILFEGGERTDPATE